MTEEQILQAALDLFITAMARSSMKATKTYQHDVSERLQGYAARAGQLKRDLTSGRVALDTGKKPEFSELQPVSPSTLKNK